MICVVCWCRMRAFEGSVCVVRWCALTGSDGIYGVTQEKQQGKQKSITREQGPSDRRSGGRHLGLSKCVRRSRVV
jgi:hypothetical protein